MTTTADRPDAAAIPSAVTPATAPALPSAPRSSRQQVLRSAGLSLTLLSLFLLGFAGFLYGLSGIQQARTQRTLYATLRNELANEVAPLGPTTPGSPIAILDIPSIGLRDLVVVEGTSPENLMIGPGLVRDAPLPGQAGVSQIYGRRATFGAPFARLGELRPGAEIKATTGQGVSTYKVAALGGSSSSVQDPQPNRLILLTAGSPAVPSYYLYVDADLISAPQPEPGGLPAIYSDETALSGDSSALVTALLWGIALVLVSGAGTVAAVRWSVWPTYVVTACLLLAVLWNLYQSLAAVLPNVY